MLDSSQQREIYGVAEARPIISSQSQSKPRLIPVSWLVKP
jgi:hypothetical protein